MRAARPSRTVLLFASLLLGLVPPAAAQTLTPAKLGARALAPAPTPHSDVHIRAAVVGDPVVGSLVRLRVRVSDDHGDDVSIRLLNPPPGLIFPPEQSSPSPLILDLEWRLHNSSLGRTTLVFEATDGGSARRSSLTVDAIDDGNGVSAAQWGDVTGDGELDLVAGASGNGGVVHIWSGAAAPGGAPVATLETALGQLGSGDPTLQLADLDLDGTLDVVVSGWHGTSPSLVGAIFVWKGGPGIGSGTGPDAILTPASPAGIGPSGETWFADLTGDGRVELLALSNEELYVWDLSQSLSGVTEPTATLQVSGFPFFSLSPPVIEDVTGDGINDLLSTGTDNGGTFGLFLWKGTPGLSGTKSQDALWSAPIGGLSLAPRVAEVTGDGISDILSFASGELRIWAGGAGLASGSAPTAILSGPAGDLFGSGPIPPPVDITADGIPDVIINANQATVAGVKEAGAIYVWPGGSGLTGSLTPQVTMTVETQPFFKQDMGARVFVRDWDGDGLPDLIAAAGATNASSAPKGEKLYVFKGAAGLSGAQFPMAVLSISDVSTPGVLGDTTGPALLFGDVTGDGFEDCITGAPDATIGAHSSAGQIYVFAGGPAALGVQGPVASLRVNPGSDDDNLGSLSPWGFGGTRQALHLVDLSGDGVLDVVAATDQFDRGSQTDNGGCFVWAGGPGMAGNMATTAKLFSGGGSQTQLGKLQGNSMRFADLTGDGYLDLLSGSSAASGGRGKFFLWAGGPALGGTHFPLATLNASLQGDGDFLGTLSGQSLHIADLTGDGGLDVVSGTWWADTGPLVDTGRLYIWGGADGFGPGSTTELGVFADPNAEAGDRLGDF